MQRSIRLATALVAGVLAIVLLPLTSAPAGATPSLFTLTLESGQGQVQIGDNPEPLSIEDPTTIEGTLDGGEDGTGAITGAAFTTPPISFQSSSGDLVVDVVATFDQIGAATGQADGLGNVAIDLDLGVTLQIALEGGATGSLATCRSEPIELELRQVAPYDTETELVTLADAQFTIPPVAASPTCAEGIVRDSVNDALAGSDNSISLGLKGALDLPPAPGEPSVTTLVSSAPSTALSTPVTFTATVAPGEGAEAEEDPTGTVEFRSGATVIGQVAVAPDLTAALTTSALPVGVHQITARYSGDATFGRSTSAPLTHTVTATPVITADIPATIVAGAAPTELTATITNPSSGVAQPNLRVDLRFGPRTGLTNGALVVEYFDGASWVPIALTGTSTQNGSYGGLTGFALAPGETREVPLRISATAGASQGALPVRVQLNRVDATTGAILETFSTATAPSAIVPATRRPTTINLPTPTPAQIRQGYSIQLVGQVRHVTGTGNPAGTAEVFVDGQPVAAGSIAGGATSPTQTLASTGNVNFFLPASLTRTLTPGPHQYSIRYHGSQISAPTSSAEGTFTVVSQPTSYPYECVLSGFANATKGARVDISADLPAVATAGSTIELERLEMSVVIEPDNSFAQLPVFYGQATDRGTSIGLTPEGSEGSFESFSFTSLSPLDTRFDVVGAEASFPLEGEPGDVVDVALEDFGLRLNLGLEIALQCAPVGDPEPIGRVTIAGTTLVADTTEIVVGDTVVLTATVAPATAGGVVEFFDGETSLGIAALTSGTATLPVDDLPAGARSITARHLGDLISPPTTSDPVVVNVRAIDCLAFAEPGNGAVVRLVYIELLGRCPDQGGYDHWVGFLDGGGSRQRFADVISASLEARMRVADDGYQTMLGRHGTPEELEYWAGVLRTGRYDRMLAMIGNSDEYWTLSGETNEGFVTRTYERVLLRTPDPAGLDYWVGRLDGGEPRHVMLTTFTRLDEPARTIVIEAFDEILDRAPTAEELTAQLAAYKADGKRSGLYGRLIGTTEFALRAQSFPN